jgi:phage terminase large subunit GpA-like protein
MTTVLDQVRTRALRSLIPAPRLRLSDWIERELVLPEGTSALPGRVRLWPWQPGIADAISDPAIERVTLVKPVRVGFTMLMVGAVAAFVVNEPAPILALLPTESDCRDFVVSDLEPVFAASPALAALLAADADEAGRNTLLSKRFPGGSLKVVAARAPRNLRRHTARILLCDEADAMESTAEGNPIRLAERRTLSFANRKIVIGSTPLQEDTSHVLRAYAASDGRVFEVPCPECGAFHEIGWADIVWEPDRSETARFKCPACEALIDERHKPAMVAAGAWRATRPEVRGHAGFRLNALVSLLANASWSKLAAEFLAAREDPDELQVFVNTVLAQGWREIGAEIDETSLQARAEPFGLDRIPAEVLVITVGVDVQDDRLETTIAGWTRKGECLVLGHVVIWGSVEDDTTWAELDELLKTRWSHPLGGKLGVDATVIDSGDNTDKVYAFCFPRLRRRIFAGKGMAGPRPVFAVAKGKIKGGGRLFLIGVDTIKQSAFNKLQRGSSIRFSDSLEAAYFEQLCAERKVVRYRRGQPVRRFERISGRARAEAWDALIYATAARAGVPVNLDQREVDLRTATPTIPPPAVVRSRWMSR